MSTPSKKIPLTTLENLDKPLPIENLDKARFECIFGNGCEGKCCQNGRPSVSKSEEKQIRKQLSRLLPLLRPSARTLIEKKGFLSNRKKLDQPMIRVIDGWCIFFNEGCVLHKLGGVDGDTYQYKPSQCALFPLEPNGDGTWYVRQWGYKGEVWDLFCLDPKASKKSPSETLQSEIKYAVKHFPTKKTQKKK